MGGVSSNRHLSVFAAWAFSFGTAVGWGAFVLPGTTLLPLAGPLGTVLGVLAGAAIMVVLAWNYHYMVCRMPSAGGTFMFVLRTFGGDHGFFCAWFLCLSYVAIVWANATALTLVARCLFGDALRIGFRYSIMGFEVSLGDIMLSVAAIVLAAAICCRRRTAGCIQTVLATTFLTGVVVCFAASLYCHGGGLRSMAPAFSPDGGRPLTQVLKIVALAPWFFVGFESICHLSSEFRFPLKRTFGVMTVAIVASVVAYAFLASIPAMTPVAGSADWVDSLTHLGSVKCRLALPMIEAVRYTLGKAGTALFIATILGAMFTNLVGNMFVASRLVGAMADESVFPEWLGRRDGNGEPRNAIFFLAGISCLIPMLGRTGIGFIVDVATVGTVIAYAYTSAAAFRRACSDGNGLTKVTGACGLLLSVVIFAIFIVPNYLSGTMMATESYLILVLWCVLGFLYYLYVLRRDNLQRYGHSLVVWVALIVMILVMSHMWMRQGMHDAMTRAFDSIGRFQDSVSNVDAAVQDEMWNTHLDEQLADMNSSLMRSGLVQVGLMIATLAIMFTLFTIVRRHERRLEREKAAAKSYFFSTVSHDIRTPLNAIIGFSEMLKKGLDSKEEREQAVDSILVSGTTLLGLINDVLDLSKLESGKMKIAVEPTDCPQLLHGVMDSFRISGRETGLELRCEIGEMPALMIDPQRLRQIVFNLVGNAVKFTEKGHVTLRADYERTKDAKMGVFRLSVEDTGCGISEDDQKRICSAYVQVGAKLARNGGTGLGLAICTQLVRAMGGELKVTSALGKGSTFEIVLHDVRSTVLPETSAPAAPVKALPVTPAASHRPVQRILLVDDSKMNLMVLKALLKKSGNYETTVAMDGQEALKALKVPGARPYDLVLTDMWMPNLDGEGLVKSIRADASLASLRVLVVTADVEIRDKAKNMGFDGILLKPVTSVTLEQALSGNGGGGT